jgi:hypothetical protein
MRIYFIAGELRRRQAAETALDTSGLEPETICITRSPVHCFEHRQNNGKKTHAVL